MFSQSYDDFSRPSSYLSFVDEMGKILLDTLFKNGVVVDYDKKDISSVLRSYIIEDLVSSSHYDFIFFVCDIISNYFQRSSNIRGSFKEKCLNEMKQMKFLGAYDTSKLRTSCYVAAIFNLVMSFEIYGTSKLQLSCDDNDYNLLFWNIDDHMKILWLSNLYFTHIMWHNVIPFDRWISPYFVVDKLYNVDFYSTRRALYLMSNLTQEYNKSVFYPIRYSNIIFQQQVFPFDKKSRDDLRNYDKLIKEKAILGFVFHVPSHYFSVIIDSACKKIIILDSKRKKPLFCDYSSGDSFTTMKKTIAHNNGLKFLLDDPITVVEYHDLGILKNTELNPNTIFSECVNRDSELYNDLWIKEKNSVIHYGNN